jgi:hypothetical protein
MQKNNSPINETEFSRIIEKRVRKYTRVNKLFRKGDRILAKDDVSGYFVRKIIKELPVKIVNDGADKVAQIWTADDEINWFFMDILGKAEKQDAKLVKMFLWVTDEELEKYCRSNGIMFKRRDKDKAIQKFIDDISLKHTDSKHKIIRNLEKLYDI